MSPLQEKTLRENNKDATSANVAMISDIQKICDAHIHLFPDRLMQAILLWFEQQGWTMPYQQPVQDLLNYLESIGVTSAFVLGYVHKKDMAAGINLWLRDLCEQHNPSPQAASSYRRNQNAVALG